MCFFLFKIDAKVLVNTGDVVGVPVFGDIAVVIEAVAAVVDEFPAVAVVVAVVVGVVVESVVGVGVVVVCVVECLRSIERI